MIWQIAAAILIAAVPVAIVKFGIFMGDDERHDAQMASLVVIGLGILVGAVVIVVGLTR